MVKRRSKLPASWTRLVTHLPLMVMPIQRVLQLVIGISRFIVEAPGERLGSPVPKKGHRKIRYYDGVEIDRAKQAEK